MRLSCVAWLAFSMIAVLACTESERLPRGPGGPSTGSGTPGDAGSDGDGGNDGKLTGRICRIVDLSRPGVCSQLADMSNIMVGIAGSPSKVQTSRDGSFTIDVGTASTVVLEAAVATPGLQRTLLLLSSQDGFTRVSVPVVDAGYLATLIDALDVPLAQETGIVAVYPTLAGKPLDGVVIDSISFSGGLFYDAGGPLDWLEAGLTSTSGAALVFGVSPPITQLVAADTITNTIVDVDSIPVGAEAVTFVSVSFD